SLFKAALFGEDANWGRILCAIGYTDAEFSADNISVEMESAGGKLLFCENSGAVGFSEEKAKKILKEDQVRFIIDLNDGDGHAFAWGCDLTYDYVKINGDYRS
ncbi:MAG: bifunctional ornithine acetyltransferase/N-acetylglutamate synthase, partial [Anaerovoracaceae bacterium]